MRQDKYLMVVSVFWPEKIKIDISKDDFNPNDPIKDIKHPERIKKQKDNHNQGQHRLLGEEMFCNIFRGNALR